MWRSRELQHYRARMPIFSLRLEDLIESQLGNPQTDREQDGMVWKIEQNTEKIRPGRNVCVCVLGGGGTGFTMMAVWFINVADKPSLTSILVWRLGVEVGVTYSWGFSQLSCDQCQVWLRFRKTLPSSSLSRKLLHWFLKCCLLWLYFQSLSFTNCPLLYLPFLKKSFSEWVIFLVSSEIVHPPVGLALVDYR